MKLLKSIVLFISSVLIASCSNPTVRTDVLVKLANSNKPLVGEAVASASAPRGTFKVSNLEGLTCNGTYNHRSQSKLLKTNINCSDGRKGQVEVVRSGPQLSNGYGKGKLNDGTTFTVQIGKLTRSARTYNIQPRKYQPVRPNNTLDTLASTLALLTPGGVEAYQRGKNQAHYDNYRDLQPYNNANTVQRSNVCAKYMTRSGWSKGYRVQATITNGSNINKATSTFNYNSFSKYVVIFWGKGRATLIELDLPYLSAIDQTGKDQQGRKWAVSTSSVCF